MLYQHKNQIYFWRVGRKHLSDGKSWWIIMTLVSGPHLFFEAQTTNTWLLYSFKCLKYQIIYVWVYFNNSNKLSNNQMHIWVCRYILLKMNVTTSRIKFKIKTEISVGHTGLPQNHSVNSLKLCVHVST